MAPDTREMCPKCQSRENSAPILYGYIGPRRSPEFYQALREHKLNLGGCIVEDENWSCEKCRTRWRGSHGTWKKRMDELLPSRQTGDITGLPTAVNLGDKSDTHPIP